MREFEHLLPMLEPPPGGLPRLQQSIGAGRHHIVMPLWRWAPAVAAVCVSAVALAVLVPPWIAQRQHTHAIVEAIQQQQLAPRLPAGGIAVTNGAAIELPSGQGNVTLYLVQSVARVGGAPMPAPPGLRVPSR